MSQIVRDLIRQMLKLRWDDETILFHLRSAKVRNGKRVLDSVLDEIRHQAIAQLDI